MLDYNEKLSNRLNGHKFTFRKGYTNAYFYNRDVFQLFPGDTIVVYRVATGYEAYGGGVADWVEFTILNKKNLQDINKLYKSSAFVRLDELIDAENSENNSVFIQMKKEKAKADFYKYLYSGTLLIGCILIIWLIHFFRNMVLGKAQQQLRNAGAINGLKLLSIYPCEFRTKHVVQSSYTGTITNSNTVSITPNYDTYASVKNGWVVKGRNVGKQAIHAAAFDATLHDRHGMKDQIRSMGASNIRPGESRNFVYVSNKSLFMNRLVIRGVQVRTADGQLGAKDLDVSIPYFRLPAWPAALLMAILMITHVDRNDWFSFFSFFIGGVALLAFVCFALAVTKNRTPVWLMFCTIIVTLFTTAPYLVLLGAVYVGLVSIKRLNARDLLSPSQTPGD